MRIVHFLDVEGYGGDARVALSLAEAQVAAGHSVHMLICESAHSAGFAERARGRVPTTEMAGVRQDSEQGRLGRLSRIVRAVRRTRPEVLHVHTGRLGVQRTDAVACRLARPQRLVATIHGAQAWAEYSEGDRRRWGQSSRMFGAVTVPTRWATATQHEAGLDAPLLQVVPNPVPSTAPTGDRAAVWASVGVPADAEGMIAYLGRLEPIKGVTELLEAYARVAEQRPGWHLVVAGTGTLEGALAARAVELGVADRAHLVGYRTDVADLLAAADLFVHVSHAESFGMSVVEAMAAGCPVLTTDVGIVSELLPEPPAVATCPAGDVDRIASAMAALVDDADARAGLATAGRAAAESFTPSAVVARFDAVYAGR